MSSHSKLFNARTPMSRIMKPSNRFGRELKANTGHQVRLRPTAESLETRTLLNVSNVHPFLKIQAAAGGTIVIDATPLT